MHFYKCFLGRKITNSNDCPLDIHRGDEYSDHFARTQMLALSAAAYWSNPQLCLTTRVNDSQCDKQQSHATHRTQHYAPHSSPCRTSATP
uniref:Uncharacterized protein n=1 Tax=Ascaris lumbricoides TaxID=6252 RepID=A0A0M3HZ67_ASCLU